MLVDVDIWNIKTRMEMTNALAYYTTVRGFIVQAPEANLWPLFKLGRFIITQ